ncbi:probable inactive poly [ADP-ribose] polymerase SRO5 [Eucalyptus grandis]|uniref:probable inactive poly [ADP-ribose] polymerase SRO5 n=1 Tax=Eucalyptus grandis TaxID=71139 RepID=UPI00192EE2A1|nr:probable inactive poly [ADP-ribose] polymerase SRO5 [Eucalyptus grandis]
MSNSMHQSSTVHDVTPDAVTPEVGHPAIDLNLPDLNDPLEDQDPDSSVSDCESLISTCRSDTALMPFISSGLTELSEGDQAFRIIRERFVSWLGAHGVEVAVVAIHQNSFSSVSAKARAQVFQLCSQAVQQRSGGGDTANVRHAWYAISREEVPNIFSYGFGYSGKPMNSALFGRGLYFAPEIHLIESAKYAPMDRDGLRHLLLCRVILGKSELVTFGSEQSHPSSEQYDSGIDDLLSPTRYIVWSTHMNTHVLPEYVISFRAPCDLRELLKILRPSDMNLVAKHYEDHMRGKISRHVLVQKVRQIIGDKLLIEIINSYGTKVRIMIL